MQLISDAQSYLMLATSKLLSENKFGFVTDINV